MSPLFGCGVIEANRVPSSSGSDYAAGGAEPLKVDEVFKDVDLAWVNQMLSAFSENAADARGCESKSPTSFENGTRAVRRTSLRGRYKYYCKICESYVPGGIEQLRGHLGTHKNEQDKAFRLRFICDICKKYCGSTDMRMHVQKIHNAPLKNWKPINYEIDQTNAFYCISIGM